MIKIAAPSKPNPSLDSMVIDAIDHIALTIADAVNDLPEEEREKQRILLVKSFSDGLLNKAKLAENRHKQVAKDSINMYLAYLKPARNIPIPEQKEETKPSNNQKTSNMNDEEECIKKFMELKAKSEE